MKALHKNEKKEMGEGEIIKDGRNTKYKMEEVRKYEKNKKIKEKTQKNKREMSKSKTEQQIYKQEK